MQGTSVEAGELPDELENDLANPDPPPGATEQAPDPDAARNEEQLDDATDQEPDELEIQELAATIAPMYRDGIQLSIEAMDKQHRPFPEDRAQRRGEQIARVLRRLGWDDEEIIAYAGLATGVGTDILWVTNLPDKPDQDDVDDQEDDDAEA
jgi:hypothetical protein